MGAAAYNRGSKALAAQIEADDRDPAFVLMDDLNAMPRTPGAVRPFGPVRIVNSHGRFWVECPVSGFGFHYPTLRAAVREWLVELCQYDATTGDWYAIPRAQEAA